MLIGCSLLLVTIEMLNFPVFMNILILAQFYRFLTVKVHTFVWLHALAVRFSCDCTTCWNEMQMQGSSSHFGCTCFTPVRIIGILTLDHRNVCSFSTHSYRIHMMPLECVLYYTVSYVSAVPFTFVLTALLGIHFVLYTMQVAPVFCLYVVLKYYVCSLCGCI